MLRARINLGQSEREGKRFTLISDLNLAQRSRSEIMPDKMNA